MKPHTVLLSIVCLAWLAGVLVWAVSDRPGLPMASIWLWLSAVGLAFVPLLLAALDMAIACVFKRGRGRS